MNLLGLYAVKDLKRNCFFSFATGSDDKSIIDMFTNYFEHVFNELDDEESRIHFMEDVQNCEIVKVANIDCFSGVLSDNFINTLCNLSSLNFRKENDENV